ncbi:unnamed protein product, partial [Rotaria magnacalcarata]
MLQNLFRDSIHDVHRRSAVRTFAQCYQPSKAVYWYTKDTFIHRRINAVSRSGDIGEFYFFRCFIADLSTQLVQLQRQQRQAHKTPSHCTLYHGLRQSEDQLQIMCALIGYVVIAKGFTSTTRRREIALMFAGAYETHSLESQAVLVEIQVDLSSPMVIAADIADLSEFPEEQEVLFNIGSTFRIESLKLDLSTKLWHCRLKANSDGPLQIHFIENTLISEYNIEPSLYTESEINWEAILQLVHRHKYQSIFTCLDKNTIRQSLPRKAWLTSSCMEIAGILHQRAIISWHGSADYCGAFSDMQHAWNLYNR